MADFNAIIDYPPAPKLNALNRLIRIESFGIGTPR